MAWCSHATGHHLNQCCLGLQIHVASLGPYEVRNCISSYRDQEVSIHNEGGPWHQLRLALPKVQLLNFLKVQLLNQLQKVD